MKLYDADGTVELPDDIQKKLSCRLGISIARRVPIQWKRDDTPPHADHSVDRNSFENTYLVYLTDSPGILMINDQEYPIRAGDGFCFSSGIIHSTVGASDRFIMGPMNENSIQVGYSNVYYTDGHGAYFNQDDPSGLLLTIQEINTIGGSGTPFHIPPGSRFVGWRYNGPPSSYGSNVISGRRPIDGDVFQPGASYLVDGGMSMTSVFQQGALVVVQGYFYLQLRSTGKIIPATDITSCELTQILGLTRSFVITNELFYQRTRANNPIPSRNGFVA